MMKWNSNVKQSFQYNVTVMKSVLGVKLGEYIVNQFVKSWTLLLTIINTINWALWR